MRPDFTNVSEGSESISGDFFIPSDAQEHFESVEFLGRGRYGEVMGLMNETEDYSECSYAVKKFVEPFRNEQIAQRCFRELQLLKELRHENIVNMRGAYTTDASAESLDNVYLVMDFCGTNLSEILKQETEDEHALNLQDIQRIVSELLRAMKYLTSAGVIHRDIKPENVAINEDLKLTLLDFGYARVVDANNEMTRDPGSSLYRAIETISFGGPDKMVYTEKVDIWAIAALLCEMILGFPVFEHKHPLIRAVELCGPIPEIVLETISERESQEFLRYRSKNAVRVDFAEYLTQNCRPWLRKDIDTVGEQLRDFIDRTLVFDQHQRMTVEEALGHPFLSSVRDISREHLAGHKVEDVKEKTIIEWREIIWNLIEKSPIRF